MKSLAKSRKEDDMNEKGTVVRFGHELSVVVRVPIRRRRVGSAA
jgi:hypothetical protein